MESSIQWFVKRRVDNFMTKLDLNSTLLSVFVGQLIIIFFFISVKLSVFLISNEVISGKVLLGEGVENG